MPFLNLSKINSILDWSKRKIGIHHADRILYFSEQEIWWASIGENVGSEENGKHHNFERPVLVLRKFNKDLFWGLPITTAIKRERWYYSFLFHGGLRSLMLTQIRAMSARRLVRKMGKMDEADFVAVRRLMAGLFVGNKTEPPGLAGGSSDLPFGETL